MTASNMVGKLYVKKQAAAREAARHRTGKMQQDMWGGGNTSALPRERNYPTQMVTETCKVVTERLVTYLKFASATQRSVAHSAIYNEWNNKAKNELNEEKSLNAKTFTTWKTTGKWSSYQARDRVNKYLEWKETQLGSEFSRWYDNQSGVPSVKNHTAEQENSHTESTASNSHPKVD